MAHGFTKHLCISSQTSRLGRDAFRFDRISWGDIASLTNFSDYDNVYVNLTALTEGRITPSQAQNVIQVFKPESWADVLAAGGSVVVVGDPNGEVVIDDQRLPREKWPAVGVPLAPLVILTKDDRELDYRRVIRNDVQAFPRIYKYLDSIAGFKYSLGGARLGTLLANYLSSKAGRDGDQGDPQRQVCEGGTEATRRMDGRSDRDLVVLKRIGKLDVERFWTDFYACKGSFDASSYWETLPKEFGFPDATPAWSP
jgi:hypothetical protein